MNNDNQLSESLVPASIHAARGTVTLIDLEGIELSEPFFDSSYHRARREGAPTVTLTIGDLRDMLDSENRSDADDSAMIFHVGRCGSTLLASMLEEVGACTFREPYAVEQAIEALQAGDSGGADALRVVIRMFARFARWKGKRSVVKTAGAPAAAAAPSVLAALSDPPSVFLRRDPVEAVASQLWDTPHYAWRMYLAEKPLTNLDSVTKALPIPMSSARYFATLQAAAEQAAGEASLRTIEYDDLLESPLGVLTEVMRHFGIAGTEEQMAEALALLSVDVKSAAREPFTNTPRPRPVPLEQLSADRVRRIVTDARPPRE